MPTLQGGQLPSSPKRLTQPASGVREAARVRQSFNIAAKALSAPYLVRELDAAAVEVAAARAEARKHEDEAELRVEFAARRQDEEEAAARVFVKEKCAALRQELAQAKVNSELEEAAEQAQARLHVRTEFAAAAEGVARAVEIAEQAEDRAEAARMVACKSEAAEAASMHRHVEEEFSKVSMEIFEVKEAAWAKEEYMQATMARAINAEQKEAQAARSTITRIEQRERLLEYKLSMKTELVEAATRTQRSLETRLVALEEGLERKNAQVDSLLLKSAEVERLEDENRMLEAALDKQGTLRVETLEAENQSLRSALLERADENDWLRMMWDAGRRD